MIVRAALMALLGLQATATFRTAIEVVQIPVSVRAGNRPVANLTAEDFVVLDSGIRQEVKAISVETIPVDVTLILDTSASTMGIAAKLERDVQQIVTMIGSSDAVRILRIDTFVEELRPLARVTRESAAVAIPRNNGVSSVHDALVAALILPVSPDRRHLVVAITDAVDTMSYTAAARVRDVAARSEALLELVVVNPPATRGPLTYVRPRFFEFNEGLLKQAAAATGGELRGRRLFGTADPVSAFKRVFDEYRQSYVLRYTPRDVPRSGWHELTVSIPDRRDYTVRARPGYFSP
jgi:VWFA-related protein